MIYYQCRFRQTAPLRIGTGTSEDSDSDVMTDLRDVPLIPGTAIAGVLRSYLNRDDGDRLFGFIREKKEEQQTVIRESRVLVSDAVLPQTLPENTFRVVRRDGVGMNERGTVLQGAKFDFEVVECLEPYTAVIELPDPSENEADSVEKDCAVLESALRDMVRHGVSFGARTTRGYGRMDVTIQKRTFSLPDQLKEWLQFDPMDADHFFGEALTAGEDTSSAFLRIEAELQMEGSFSVRQYLSALPETKEGKIAVNAPVYGPLTNQQNCPVIPGTSWAGVFRHHMEDLIDTAAPVDAEALKQALKDLFGVVEQEGGKPNPEKRKSRIFFSETAVQKAENAERRGYTVTRVAVERFTGAPRNQGLFSSQVAWGGTGKLSIQLPAETSEPLRRLLAAALNDLNLGLLTAGGESAVGRGLCRVERLHVNGRDVTEAVHNCDTGYIDE